MDAPDGSNLRFRVSVRGTVRSDMRASIMEKWSGARGGVDPVSESPYMTVPCHLDEIEGCLRWLTETFPGDYNALEIGISTTTALGWGEVLIPSSVASSAKRHGASIKVFFWCSEK